jgi:iron complex outermembrane receptor protein
MRRDLLKSTAITFVLIAPCPAIAQAAQQTVSQDMPAAAATAPLSAEASTSTVPDEAGQAATGGDIVVTAQRRSELLREVPATVTVLSNAALQAASITNSLQLTQVTPGLQFAQLGAYAQPVLRGVGSQISASGNATNVAVYIDGIYQATPLTNNFDFFGLEGIEVLKGPQGTLYGRNAAGGAILVTSRKPTYDTHGEFQATYGSYDERRFNGYFSTGLSSNLAFNVTGQYRASDGYIDNIFPVRRRRGANEVWSGRAKLLWQPADNAEFLLTVDHTDSDDPVGMLSGTYRGNSFAIGKGLPVPRGQYEVALSTDPYFRFRTSGVTLRGQVDLGPFTVTSLTGGRRTVSHQLIDADYTPAATPANGGISISLDGPQAQFSQEFLVNSNANGPLKWTAGATYNDESDRQINVVNGALSFNARTKTQNVSAFGELTYNLTDALSITGGARYSSETKHLTTSNTTLFKNVSPVTFSAWTPRVIVKLAVTPKTNIYASYNKGFKSGGFNPAGPAVTILPFRPERINAYEAGIKSDEIRMLSFELAGFLYQYSNIQFQTANPTPVPGAPLLTIVNAAKARIYGGELNSTLRPFEGFSAQVGVAYTHGRYNSFPSAPITSPIPTGGNVTTFASGAGKTLIRVPTWSGNIGLNYKQPVSFGTIDVSGNLYFSSGYYGDVGNRLRQPSYQVVNTTLGLTLPGDRFRVSFWTRNLFDQKYDLQLYDPAQSDRHITAPPRTLGGTFEAKF